MSSISNNYINLDMSIPRLQNIRCVKGDIDSRIINITVTDRGQVYNLSNVDIYFRMKKPDGKNIFWKNGTDSKIVVSNNKVVITLDANCTAVAGVCQSELQIVDNASKTVISTMLFNVIVENSAISDEEIKSTDDYQALNELILEVGNIDTNAKEYRDETKAMRDEVAINTEIVENTVTEVNEKYLAAKSYAENAKTSEANAKTSEQNAKASETASKTSETNAKTSETRASQSAITASTSASTASTKASEASTSASNASTSEANASNSATLSKSWAVGGTSSRSGEDTNNSKYYSTQASSSATKAKTSETNASNSAINATEKANAASISATNAEDFANNAKTYMDNAEGFKNEARVSASSASQNAINADESATNASQSEINAARSEANASKSETNSKNSETNAKKSETNAKTSETNAKTSETKAKEYMDDVHTYKLESQSWAIGGTDSRSGEDTDNSKYYSTQSATSASEAKKYYEQSKAISESFSGALRPMGTCTFSELPSLSSVSGGDMYNVSDEFTTTSDFKEGSGLTIPAGSNVYKTSDSKWDILAGSPVTGVKGDNETSYRRGNVNITKANVGLGNVPNVTTNDQTVTYSETSTLTKLTSGEKLAVAFGKISKAITDLISHIGDSVKHITSTERTNWGTAYTHSQSTHAPSNAQANIIETIKVNNTALTPSSKAVNITVPTNNNQLTNGAGYITSTGTAKTISDTLPISKGGTGKTTAVDAANSLINSLEIGDSTPTDADYYISQYVNGGTTTTSYHRRPMSALWNYIKSKLSTVATSGSYNDLSNKPTFGTASAKDVATSGNASTTQVVMGNDTRLTDSRNASDVYAWAKSSTKPTYTASEVGAMSSTNPVGTGSFSMGRKSGTTVGENSHTEGYETTASGRYSHAEGIGSTASANSSHAEGYGNTANGAYSHVEGGGNTANAECSHAEGGGNISNGLCSHAEGASTIASGEQSHAGGYGTKASGDNQTAIGKFNVEDTTSAFIVGNGTSNTARSNAMSVAWDGNLKTAGDITNGNGVSLDALNSNLLKKQTSGEKIYTQKDIAVAPSESAFNNAPIRTDSNPANGSRAGIGFHNSGYNGCFLYLETDNNLYLILNNGDKYKINMTRVD